MLPNVPPVPRTRRPGRPPARLNGTDRAAAPASQGAYPRLARLIAYDAVGVAVEAFRAVAAEAAAAPVAADLLLAAALLSGLGDGALPPPTDSVLPDVPAALSLPLRVPEGLRPLLGELAYFTLETRRFAEAGRLFAALGTLAPAEAAGPVGLAAVHLAAGDPLRAEKAARHAVAADPSAPAAHAVLAEALVMSGRAESAARVLARAQGAVGPAAGWLRLLRVAVSRGWLDFGGDDA